MAAHFSEKKVNINSASVAIDLEKQNSKQRAIIPVHYAQYKLGKPKPQMFKVITELVLIFTLVALYYTIGMFTKEVNWNLIQFAITSLVFACSTFLATLFYDIYLESPVHFLKLISLLKTQINWYLACLTIASMLEYVLVQPEINIKIQEDNSLNIYLRDPLNVVAVLLLHLINFIIYLHLGTHCVQLISQIWHDGEVDGNVRYQNSTRTVIVIKL